MILSRKFVSDYIELDDNLSINTIAEDMAGAGNEYDFCGPLVNCTNLVIGEVIECMDHPDSDHLHVCKVNIGSEVLDIVCGAPNCRKGLKVIVALVGAKLSGGEIKAGMIRGQVSNGMLCSKAELGIDSKFLSDEDKNGICELGSDAKVGDDPIKYLGLDDEIIDFELTANRGDLLSVLGLSYELGAIYNKKVKDIDLSYEVSDNIVDSKLSLSVLTDNCSLFLARRVNNVKIEESPDFIKNRLLACGIRPINNVVDISNYVMLETGQPLHFYDADKLGENIIVRMAKNEEELVTLDGVTRSLSNNDIVISNKFGAVGLAGVMGGLDTYVTSDTKNIIIESAIFDGVLVRKTSKKIVRSEASNRFEKGLDPKRSYMAMDRACNLLSKYAGGTVLGGTVSYDKTNKEDKKIDITCDNINNVLGTNIEIDTIVSIFDRLGFTSSVSDNSISVSVPTRRLDINIKEDLIEEVGRIYGINNIQGKLPKLGIKKGSYDKTNRLLKNKLVDLGFNEVLTQIFINDGMGHMYTNDSFDVVKLLDPLSIEKNALRYSLIPSLMKVYDYNKSRNVKDMFLFEIGKGFYLRDNCYGEDNKLCFLATGKYFSELGNDINTDFYVVKGVVEEILDYLGYSNRYSFIVSDIPKEFHPGVSASINLQGKNIGIVGKLHPSVNKDNVYVCEINLDLLFNNRTSNLKYRDVSKYLGMSKDVAFVVDKGVTNKEVMDVIKKSGGRLLTSIELFDLYEGDKISSSCKSLAYNLRFEDANKTLTDSEVMEVFNRIITDVENKLGAKLRNN